MENNSSQEKIPANTVKKYFVQKEALPISCPTEEMSLWNAHPRVFLPLGEEVHEIACPYCGTLYILEENV